jgi:hypothetical protein
MPYDDIDSYWEGIRPRREPEKPPAERVERTRSSRVVPFEESIPFIVDPQPVTPPIQQAGRPPHGLIDRHNPDAGLSTIRNLRQTLQARALEGTSQIQAQNATGVDLDPDMGLRREVEAVRTLREAEAIRPERRRPNTWAELEPLSIREERIRNHAYMDGLSSREEPNGNSTLNRLMSSLAALGITGSVGQERLPNGNRAVTILMMPVHDEEPHFLVGARVTQNGGVEVTVEFPEE